MTTRQLPLDGLKVVELGQLIAGPFATKLLGEFGADVIKIEPPGTGDPLRKWRILEEGTSLWWHVQSRTKRSVTLDLRSDWKSPEMHQHKFFSHLRNKLLPCWYEPSCTLTYSVRRTQTIN